MERINSQLLQFLADNGITVQMIIDRANERFAPVWYPRYFRVAPPTVSLDFTTIIGKSRVEAMASIVARGAEFPMRSRAGILKVQGEVPSIGVMRSLDARQIREISMMRTMPGVTDIQRLNIIIDYIFNDFQYCANAVNKRLDAMAIQAVSTGEITIDATNNPDGITFTVPLLMDAGNKLKPVKVWSDTTADIIKDLEDVREAAIAKGRAISKVLISRSLWLKMTKNTSLQNFVKGYFNPGSNLKYAFTLSSLNQALTENQFWNFEIVDELTAVEKDGIPSPFRAWDQDNAVFVPTGELGIIHNSLADEQLTPIPNVQYGTAGNILLSRWYQHKPVTEFTAGEWNAFPGLEAIDGIFILDTATAA